jgi:type IV pilus assembly protein PilP
MKTFPLAIAWLVGLAACNGSPGTAPPPAARAQPPVVPTIAAASGVAAPELSESDFQESDHNRNPFRAPTIAVSETPAGSDLPTVLPQYSIDELRLVAIVLADDAPRAMVLDPGGTGHVVKRGDYIGRPDLVHVGGVNGSEHQLNWRVDRVRDGELVLNREDRAGVLKTESRVIALHATTDDRVRKL